MMDARAAGQDDEEIDPNDVQMRKLGFAAYAMKLYGALPEAKVTPAKLSWPWRCEISKDEKGRPIQAKRSRANSPAYPQNWYWNGLRTSLEIPPFPPFP